MAKSATSAMIESSKAGQAYAELMTSDNEYDACYGRMLNHLTPVLQQLMDEERQRGTDPNVMINIAPGVAISILFQLMPPFQFPQTEQMLVHTAADLISAYKTGSAQYLQALKEQENGEQG